MKISAPAKINLYLKILGKRPDGFHELETLMCPLSLCDEVLLEKRPSGISLEVEGADLPTGPENLAYRAAQLVQEKAGISQGIHIRLLKRIPSGGGLAGGSSNAAAVLKGANALWKAGLSEEVLHELAASLGSDINFFLQDAPAVCTGRGETVAPLPFTTKLPGVLLINPGFGVSTPWAYKTYASSPSKGEAGGSYAWFQDKACITLRNDLEPAVFTKYLWIQEARHWLRQQPETLDALMSGSGATVFALFEDKASGKSLLSKAKEYFGPKCWYFLGKLEGNRSKID